MRSRGEEASARFLEGRAERIHKWIQHREAIDAEAIRWQALLRMNSNAHMDFWINDADPLFVFVRNSEIEDERFDRMLGRVLQS